MGKPNLQTIKPEELAAHSCKEVYQAYRDENINTVSKDKKMIFTLLRRMTQLEAEVRNLKKQLLK